jgi:2,3-diketo-5-methylthio-1-phosphopentane phosphatase
MSTTSTTSRQDSANAAENQSRPHGQHHNLPRPIAVFADFDGTIAVEDLGDKLFVEHGDFAGCYPRLQNGEWSVAQYWRGVCASLTPSVTPAFVRAWAMQQPADEYVGAFAAFCRERGIPLTVVSDGFDAYINTVLEREGLGDVAVRCNTLFDAEGKVRPQFPGASESCACFCASCKRNALLASAEPDALVVYIGDGYSDFCAAEHADIIFAKHALAAYCTKQRIPHYPYKTFRDVLAIFRAIVQKKRFKPRHQAVLKRKEAFEIE